jgi:GTPase SAR1 family protein
MASLKKFRILFLGDSGVGKTSFIQRNFSGEFTDQHNPTLGNNETSIDFKTNLLGKITIECVDTSGAQEKFDFGSIDGIIIMFDVTNRGSHDNIKFWLDKCPSGIPRALVGNKVDCEGTRKVIAEHITIQRPLMFPHFDVSVKTGHRLRHPLFFFVRKHTGQMFLDFE